MTDNDDTDPIIRALDAAKRHRYDRLTGYVARDQVIGTDLVEQPEELTLEEKLAILSGATAGVTPTGEPDLSDWRANTAPESSADDPMPLNGDRVTDAVRRAMSGNL